MSWKIDSEKRGYFILMSILVGITMLPGIFGLFNNFWYSLVWILTFSQLFVCLLIVVFGKDIKNLNKIVIFAVLLPAISYLLLSLFIFGEAESSGWMEMFILIFLILNVIGLGFRYAQYFIGKK